MDGERKELKEIKALLLALVDRLTGLLATLRKIFQTMALVFSVVLLALLGTLAWFMFF